MSTKVNSGTPYAGKYFKLMTNLDMAGVSFNPIGYGGYPFRGAFDGNGCTIGNISLLQNTNNQKYMALFGYVDSDMIYIKNLNLIYSYIPNSTETDSYFGGLIGYYKTGYSTASNIENVNIEYNTDVITLPACSYIGGLIGYIEDNTFTNSDYHAQVNISNCTVSGFNVNIDSSYTSFVYFGGIVGCAQSTNIIKCRANVNMSLLLPGYVYIGGIAGKLEAGTIADCLADGSLLHTDNNHVETSYPYYIGGIVGSTGREKYVATTSTHVNNIIANNLFQGTLKYYPSKHATGTGDTDLQECIGGILGGSLRSDGNSYSLSYVYNNIANCSFDRVISSSGWRPSFYYSFELAGGVYGGRYDPLVYSPNVYNSSKMSINTPGHQLTSQYGTLGATTDANIKLASTYADWEAFDEHWIINPKINDGYPMLRAFVDIAFVTGFDGSGTEADPYLIKTHQDLLGMSNYYNNNDKLETDVYWQLANNIDVSVDANGLPIHFTPICYDKEFDGYFDGNGKTISGLLIDNQYAYTGLFGTIAANHYVKDLTVTGNVYWDQAYAVGGVAGRVMDGGYLQNCKFDGNIIGVLNTKQSTETNGVIGKYGINGAIDCTATYTDLKYAKIGGTTDAPTYTYYLYDWARITTSLYNKKVG